MTIAELIRAIESKKRIEKEKAKEQAAFNYILADLIGHSISRIYSSSATMPKLEEAYSDLFDSAEIEEIHQEKKDELSVLRFKQFALNFNKKFDKEEGKKSE